MNKLEISKELLVAKGRLTEIQLDRVATEKSSQEIQTKITTLGAAPATGHSSRFAQAARRMLSGGAKEPDIDIATLRAELGKVRDHLAVLREAEAMQRRVVADVVAAESIVVCESLRDEHISAVRRIAEALRALLDANAAERAIRDRITNADLHCHLTPMPMTAAGLPDDTYSRGSYWLIEAVKFGFIDAKTLPKNVRAMIPSAAPKKVEKQRAVANADGWLNAS